MDTENTAITLTNEINSLTETTNKIGLILNALHIDVHGYFSQRDKLAKRFTAEELYKDYKESWEPHGKLTLQEIAVILEKLTHWNIFCQNKGKPTVYFYNLASSAYFSINEWNEHASQKICKITSDKNLSNDEKLSKITEICNDFTLLEEYAKSHIFTVNLIRQ